MIKYSIITIVNDDEVYTNCLLSSIKREGRQDVEYIPIYNYENNFTASIALNFGINAMRGEYAILVHQDVSIVEGFFRLLDNLLKPPIMVLGASGVELSCSAGEIGEWGGFINNNHIVGVVYSDDEQTPYWNGKRDILKVHCLDEILIVVHRDVRTRFDNKIRGFHFYGVDFCLQARKDGYDIYSAGLPIIHHARHSQSIIKDRSYWKTLRQLYDKWKSHYSEVLSTHMHWNEFGDITSYIGFKIQSDDGHEVQVLGAKLCNHD